MAEAEKDKAEAQYKMAELKLDQEKFQLEVAKFEWQKQVDATEATLEAEQARPVGLGDGK